MTEKLFVTDTHPLVHFFCHRGKKLNKNVHRIFEDSIERKSSAIFVPAPVLWEISTLLDDGDIKISGFYADWIDNLFKNSTFISVPFDHETVKRYHDLRFHNDPFDRAIVATALQLNLPLITNDAKIHETKPCELVWG